MDFTRSPAPPATQPAATDAEALLQEGLAHSHTGDSADAVRLFERAAVAAPANPLPHFLLASELASMGRIDEAEASFANAVLLAPHFHLARYQLGLLQFSSGRAAAALISWQPLFALEDAQPFPHFVRGFAALAQDDATAARAHFDAGLARNTGNEALSGDVRKVIERMEQGMQQAAPKATEAASAEPSANHILIANYGKVGTLH